MACSGYIKTVWLILHTKQLDPFNNGILDPQNSFSAPKGAFKVNGLLVKNHQILMEISRATCVHL